MGLFKKKVVKDIYGATWGHLVNVYKFDVDTLSRDIRCVTCEGTLNDRVPVTFLRIFSLSDTERKGVVVKGWETFDEHPNLILFEGYLTKDNKPHLERKVA